MIKLRKRVVSFLTSLKYKIQGWACKVICVCHVHTQPRWIQKEWPWPPTYSGQCRNCMVKLTKDYRYDDFSGPLYDGIEENPRSIKSYMGQRFGASKSRDLGTIVSACVNMFIKDLPTNKPL